jgi:hypothetical protein
LSSERRRPGPRVLKDRVRTCSADQDRGRVGIAGNGRRHDRGVDLDAVVSDVDERSYQSARSAPARNAREAFSMPVRSRSIATTVQLADPQRPHGPIASDAVLSADDLLRLDQSAEELVRPIGRIGG